MILVNAGDTSQTFYFFLQDSSSTVGAGLQALAYNTSGLSAYYVKAPDGAATSITLASQTYNGSWTSGGFAEVNSSAMSGIYRFDAPDAMVSTAGIVILYLSGAANLAPIPIFIDCRRVPSNIEEINKNTVYGVGTSGDKWRGTA